MNDNAVALLDKIAAKLGVTAQYLWSVMLKQAPVFVTVSIIEFVVTFIVIALLIRYRKPVSKWAFEVGENGDGLVGVFGSIIFIIVGVVWTIACLCAFEHVITAIFNPEYWALETLLSALKSTK